MRQIKIGSYVQIVKDKDSGMLIGRKGTVKSVSTSNDGTEYIWVKFDNHSIALPFGSDEVKAANRTKGK